MDGCYSCMLEFLLGLVLSHPFPQRPSKPCEVAFGPEPAGRHFTPPHQVYLTGTVPSGQTLCTRTWLYLVPVLWPIFTHTEPQYFHAQIAPLFGMQDYTYKYDLASAEDPCTHHDAGLKWIFIKALKWNNTIVVSYIWPTVWGKYLEYDTFVCHMNFS